jgi:hypothetical protein
MEPESNVAESPSGEREEGIQAKQRGAPINAEGPTFRPTLPVKVRAVGTNRTSPDSPRFARSFARINIWVTYIRRSNAAACRPHVQKE